MLDLSKIGPFLPEKRKARLKRTIFFVISGPVMWAFGLGEMLISSPVLQRWSCINVYHSCFCDVHVAFFCYSPVIFQLD